jgi:hypothetical protein
VLQEPSDAVGRAIRETLPTGAGQRNRQLFRLARRLRALPHLAAASAKDLQPIVRRFHELALPVIRTKAFAETWNDFALAWDRIKHPAGSGPLVEVWAKALAAGPPPLPRVYLLEGIAQLASLCHELQRLAGTGTFFLGCRTAGELLGVHHTTAWRFLRILENDRVLVRIETGNKASGRANEWRFAAGGASWAARGSGSRR